MATLTVQLPGALTATCTTQNGMSFLQVTDATSPADTREVGGLVQNVPQFGLHFFDMDYAMGNLLDLARTKARVR